MERLRRMTTIAKKPRQSEETNKILFEKLDKLSNLEWAKWGGWFDSDGSFSFDKQKQLRAALQLSDKSPVQMFADTFEINLLSSNRRTNYEKSTGTNSEKFSAYLTRARAVYFCKKVHPYIINKNNHLNNVLAKANIKINDGYLTMNDEEFFVWLVSFRFYISLNSCRLSTNSVTSLSCPSLWHPRTPKQHEQHHTKKELRTMTS